jgi:hypothetical protein
VDNRGRTSYPAEFHGVVSVALGIPDSSAVIGPVVLVGMWMLLDWPRRNVGAAIPALAG